MTEHRLPLQEQFGANVLSALLFGEDDKATQDPFGRAEVVSEAAP
jgi:hypothetical protein